MSVGNGGETVGRNDVAFYRVIFVLCLRGKTAEEDYSDYDKMFHFFKTTRPLF